MEKCFYNSSEKKASTAKSSSTEMLHSFSYTRNSVSSESVCEHTSRKRLKTITWNTDQRIERGKSELNGKVNGSSNKIITIKKFTMINPSNLINKNLPKTSTTHKSPLRDKRCLSEISSDPKLQGRLKFIELPDMHDLSTESLPISEYLYDTSLSDIASHLLLLVPATEMKSQSCATKYSNSLAVSAAQAKSPIHKNETDNSSSNLDTLLSSSSSTTPVLNPTGDATNDQLTPKKDVSVLECSSVLPNQSWVSGRPGNALRCSSSLNTGMWSSQEMDQLKENVQRYCQQNHVQDPSSVIFGMSKSERCGFYKDIAVGINRPLFSVYRKVIRMYDCLNNLGRYSREEVDRLRSLRTTHGNNWQAIGAELGRSSASVKDRCRLLAGSRKGAWTPQEEDALARAVTEQLQENETMGASSSIISWSGVSAVVGSRTEKQCRAKWLHYLNWKRTSGVTWSKTDDLQLICRLSVCGVTEEGSVDWASLARGWPAVRSPHWLRGKWWTMKQRLTGPHNTLRENCRLLYNSTSSSILKSTFIEVPTATTATPSRSSPDAAGRSTAATHDYASAAVNIRLCIPAANFSDLINVDCSADQMHTRLQQLIQSAVVITESSASPNAPHPPNHRPLLTTTPHAPRVAVAPNCDVDDASSDAAYKAADYDAEVSKHEAMGSQPTQYSDVSDESSTYSTDSGAAAAAAAAVVCIENNKEDLFSTKANLNCSSDGEESRCISFMSDDVCTIDDDIFSINGGVCVIGSEVVCAVTAPTADANEGECYESDLCLGLTAAAMEAVGEDPVLGVSGQLLKQERDAARK